MTKQQLLLLILLLPPLGMAADKPVKGPVIENYGAVFPVKQTKPLTGEESFQMAFDMVDMGKEDRVNGKLDSLARFLNMHARAGVDPDNIQLALVSHGDSGFALLNDEQYRAKYGRANPNTPLLNELLEHKVRIIICGQSAAHHGIDNDHLHPGVEVALSAMTAHALLQQQGYSLNPPS